MRATGERLSPGGWVRSARLEKVVRVIVIGGTRFIGRASVELLVARGHRVLVVHRGQWEPSDLVEVEHLHVDRAELAAVRDRVAGSPRPRVLALEWLDPPFAGGHWVPEMVALAGGIDVFGEPGGHSARLTWDQVAAADPDVIVAMPCGYDEACNVLVVRIAQAIVDAVEAGTAHCPARDDAAA